MCVWLLTRHKVGAFSSALWADVGALEGSALWADVGALEGSALYVG